MFGDAFFKKIENKTNVDKKTIMSLANKVQNSNMKDENVLRELIKEISQVAGKEVSEEKTQKIIDTIVQDKVPKDLNNFM